MSIKIIFLDVDGVLNTDFTEDRCDGFLGIDDKFVTNLRKIIDSTDNCKIVLSSTWRLGYTKFGYKLTHHYDYLTKKLAKEGLAIFDNTPELSRNDGARGKEIHQWLENHKELNIDSWVVLDDEWFWDFRDYDVYKHLVRTNGYYADGGLNDESVKEAIRILKGELNDS